MKVSPTMNLNELAEYMGDANEQDASYMRDMLVNGCWQSVADVPDELWGAMLTEVGERALKLDKVWRSMPEDYRGIAGERWGEHEGKRTVMVNRDGRTCLVLLEDLTNDEINQRLPRSAS